MFGTTILKIIARDGGNHHVLQFQSFHRLRHPLWFVFFERERFGRRYRAKSTSTRTTLTRDHHRRRALAPAFPTVWALRALANGVQSQIGDKRLGREKNGVRRQSDFDPGRFLRLVKGGIDFGAGHLLRRPSSRFKFGSETAQPSTNRSA
jgi:hypothetical protein